MKQGKLQIRQPDKPGTVVSVDLFGHMMYKGRKAWILTMVDVFSKWVFRCVCYLQQEGYYSRQSFHGYVDSQS